MVAWLIQKKERRFVVYPGCWTKLLLTYLQLDPAGGGDSYTLCWGIELGSFRYQGRPSTDPLSTRPKDYLNLEVLIFLFSILALFVCVGGQVGALPKRQLASCYFYMSGRTCDFTKNAGLALIGCWWWRHLECWSAIGYTQSRHRKPSNTSVIARSSGASKKNKRTFSTLSFSKDKVEKDK